MNMDLQFINELDELNNEGIFVRHNLNSICYVCGFDYTSDKPWGEDGESPDQSGCVCCGVQFGYEDLTVQNLVDYRKKWLSTGARWINESFRPEHWSFEKQFVNVPMKYR